MNEYDSNRIYDIAGKINYRKTNVIDDADCYVLNTCHIREKATEKVYHDIGRVKKKFRNKKKPFVIVTGCVAQAEGDILLKREKYIDAVLGPQSYHEISNTLLKLEKNIIKINSTEFSVKEKFDNLNYFKNSNSNVSSFLTIQEGCDKFCKFCVVPYTRGAEYSRSFSDLLNESNQLVANGSKEITLLGQNVNAYNYKGKKLSDLIYAISEIEDLKRIKFTTSHPIDFSDDLIRMYDNSNKLMPLIHLPIQSGSNKILKSMNRKHTVEDYIDIIEKLKKINPFIKFTSDFIIGYPGETNKDFEDTIKILNKIKFINCYSFIFSPRPGTPAAKMKEINFDISKERLIVFQEAADKIKINYRQGLLNKKSKVLFENRLKEDHKFFGRDEFSNSVVVEDTGNLRGKIKEVEIIHGNKNTLFGKLIQKDKKREFAA